MAGVECVHLDDAARPFGYWMQGILSTMLADAEDMG